MFTGVALGNSWIWWSYYLLGGKTDGAWNSSEYITSISFRSWGTSTSSVTNMQLIFPLSWVLIILNNLHLNTAGDILLVDQPIQTCHINWWTVIDTLLLTLQSYPSTLISEFHDVVCPVDPHRATRLKPILPKDHVKTFQWKHPHSGNEGMTLNIPLQFFYLMRVKASRPLVGFRWLMSIQDYYD